MFVGEIGVGVVDLLGVEDVSLVGWDLGVVLLVLRVDVVPHNIKYYKELEEDVKILLGVGFIINLLGLVMN